MVPTKIFYVCLHFLILVYTVQSYVVLRANVDDIRRVARKFVSESFANKIVDFVMKASESMATNEPEPPKHNTMGAVNSRYKIKNKARQEEMAIDKKEAREPKRINLGRAHNIVNSVEESVTKKTRKPEQKLMQRQPNLNKRKEKRIFSKEEFHSNRAEFQDKHKETNTRKGKHANIPTDSDSYEEQETRDYRKNSIKYKQTTDLRGFNVDVTTAKQRNEFDEYDNFKDPNLDFIATSGPVHLPKVPFEEPWWEKELAKEKKPIRQ